MPEIPAENSSFMILALLGALVIHVSLAFLLKLPSFDFHGIRKGTLKQIEIKLVSDIENKNKISNGKTKSVPTPRPITPLVEKTDAREVLIKKTDTSSEAETIAFNYSDLEEWIKNDTARTLEQKNKVTFGSKARPQKSRTVSVEDNINREQMILKDKVITTYESGWYSADVKTKLFGKDYCYKFDHSPDSFGVVTPYKCPQKDVIQLNIK